MPNTSHSPEEKPDPADVPNPEEFRPPTEETDPELTQRPYPTPGEEHLKEKQT